MYNLHFYDSDMGSKFLCGLFVSTAGLFKKLPYVIFDHKTNLDLLSLYNWILKEVFFFRASFLFHPGAVEGFQVTFTAEKNCLQ